ncbi:MAG TPA: response regulator [Vicinamibacterales bacterium]|nr:response regulator [Vicinamibacterales bacterium]
MPTLDAVMPEHTTQSRTQDAPFRVLVADDQRDVVDAIRLLLTANDFQVTGAATPAEALSLARDTAFDLALIDLNYEKGRTSGEQGLELIASLLKHTPSMSVVVMTAWGSIEVALEAMRRGARDFVEKPWDDTRMIALMRVQAELGRSLRRIAELEAENRRLKARETGGVGGALGTMKVLEAEGLLVRQAMEQHGGNVSRAARTLGLSRSALYRRLERHKI